MKKSLSLALLICVSIFVISNCHSSKKTAASTPAAGKLTYTTDVQPVVAVSCSPCHFPGKGGNKKPLDSYDAVKGNIDEMVRRIELNPTDKGFMPFKHPTKLSADTIAIITRWKDGGMAQ